MNKGIAIGVSLTDFVRHWRRHSHEWPVVDIVVVMVVSGCFKDQFLGILSLLMPCSDYLVR